MKYSYQLISEAQSKLGIKLDSDSESYLTRLFAKHIDNPHLNQVPICVRLLEGSMLPTKEKKVAFLSSAEECLLIDGLELGKPRWPSATYYRDLGTTAYDQIAYFYHPHDELYQKISKNFIILSQVLTKCKVAKESPLGPVLVTAV